MEVVLPVGGGEWDDVEVVLPDGGEIMKPYLEISKLNKIYPTPKGPAIIVKDFDLTIGNG